MSTITCPSVLPNVPNMNCSVKYGQIQKIAFQRIGNTFTTETILTKAAWFAFLSAIDSTKLVITPFVESPDSDGGDERTFGSGNEVRDGIEYIMGINPVKMTFALRRYPQIIIKALKILCKIPDLGVYFITGNGGVIGLKEEDTVSPLPIRAMFVGDLLLHGLAQPDRNTLSFRFKENYSDNLAVFYPQFDIINELYNIDMTIGNGSFSLAFNGDFDV